MTKEIVGYFNGSPLDNQFSDAYLSYLGNYTIIVWGFIYMDNNHVFSLCTRDTLGNLCNVDLTKLKALINKWKFSGANKKSFLSLGGAVGYTELDYEYMLTNTKDVVSKLSLFIRSFEQQNGITVDGIDIDYELSDSLYIPNPPFNGRLMLGRLSEAFKKDDYLKNKKLSHAPQVEYMIQALGGVDCSNVDSNTWVISETGAVHTGYTFDDETNPSTAGVMVYANEYIDYLFIQFYNNSQDCDMNGVLDNQVRQLAILRDYFTKNNWNNTKIIFGKCNQGCDLALYSLSGVDIPRFFSTSYKGRTLQSLIDGFMYWAIDSDLKETNPVVPRVNAYLNSSTPVVDQYYKCLQGSCISNGCGSTATSDCKYKNDASCAGKCTPPPPLSSSKKNNIILWYSIGGTSVLLLLIILLVVFYQMAWRRKRIH
jgi:hypothetical protein